MPSPIESYRKLIASYAYCTRVVFLRRDYLVDHMKRTVVHEGARTGDYLIGAKKEFAACSISRATRLSLDDCTASENTCTTEFLDD